MNTATDTLTDSQYDTADAIELWLEAHPGFHSASAIGRGVKVTTHEAKVVLEWMARNVFVLTAGNGAWTNWSSRR